MTSISTRWRRATPKLRERAQFMARCRGQVAHAKAQLARVRHGSCADVDAAAVTSRAALARLPVTRKSASARHAEGARGRSAAWPRRDGARAAGRARVFASPGPDLRARGRAPGLLAARRGALFAAGFRAGDLVHNCFSYHLSPAGEHVRDGPAQARLCGDSRWRRPDRAAMPRDRRPAALGYVGPLVPEDPAGEGGRA